MSEKRCETCAYRIARTCGTPSCGLPSWKEWAPTENAIKIQNLSDVIKEAKAYIKKLEKKLERYERKELEKSIASAGKKNPPV